MPKNKFKIERRMKKMIRQRLRLTTEFENL